MDSADKSFWEWFNYGFVLLALAGIVGITWTRRKNVRPIDLSPSGRTSTTEGGAQ